MWVVVPPPAAGLVQGAVFPPSLSFLVLTQSKKGPAPRCLAHHHPLPRQVLVFERAFRSGVCLVEM